jgi:hypothetical protein
MATYRQIYNEAIAADDAWSAELTRLFGKQAGDKRYTKEGKGEEGSELRRLHNNKRECDDALAAYHMSTEACGF